MVDGPSGSTDRDRQVNEIITAYLQAVDAGQTPDRQEWLRQYPEYAAELQAFLADYERVDRMAEPLRPAEKGTGPICRNGPEAGTDAQRWSSHQLDLSASPPNEAATVDSGQPVPVGVGTTVRYFGDYELLEEIGRGGMGVVYKARQVSLNRVVALKMILAGQLATESDVRRFHTEAEAAAQLDHPGIVPIFEVGQHEGQHYFSMAFVDGESLARRVAQGVMEPRAAAALMKEVAEAIAYAHAQGVIHRDLKPGNILLKQGRESRVEGPESRVESREQRDRGKSRSASGSGPSTLDSRPVVTDFGLAKRVEDDGSGLTATGQVLGTPSYMPPEQAAGKTKEIGPRADVYSLGAVLYCVLTGRPPFQAASPLETLRQVLERDPVPLRALNPAVPRDLETIGLKCLEKDARRRYASAQELGDELQRFLDGRPIQARPIGAAGRAWRWCRRNPLVASLTTAVALSLLLGMGIAAHFAVEANRQAEEAWRQEKRANQEAADANQQRDRATDNLDLARRRLYISDMRLAQRAWDDLRVDRLEELLDGQRPDNTGGTDYRGFEWYYWQRVRNSQLRTLAGHTGRVNGLAFSTDGRRLASGSEDKTVRLWDLATGQELLTLKGYTGLAAFSPDGKQLAVHAAGGTEVKVYDVSGSREPYRLEAGEWGRDWGKVGGMAFSPNGKLLAAGTGGEGSFPSEIKLWDAPTGRDHGAIRFDAEGVNRVAFSPDSQRLATGGWDPTLRVWDVATRRELFAIETEHVVTSVLFSPDGKRLAAGSTLYSGKVNVFDAANGKTITTLDGQAEWAQALAFSQDGQRLATSSGHPDGGVEVRIWDVASGRHLFRLQVPGNWEESDFPAAFSPDLRQVAMAWGNTVRLWDATSTSEAIACQCHRGGVNALAFAHDDRHVASVMDDGTIRVWDTASGLQVLNLGQERIGGSTEHAAGIAFGPGDQWLAATRGPEVTLWDLPSGKPLVQLKGSEASAHDELRGGWGVTSLAVSPDGEWLAASTWYYHPDAAGEFKLYRVRDLGLPAVVGAGSMLGAGPTFGAGLPTPPEQQPGQPTAEATSPAPVVLLRGREYEAVCLAFSPDSRQLASADYSETVTLWDIRSLVTISADDQGAGLAKDQVEATLARHSRTLTAPCGVNGVAYSPDGGLLAIAGSDATVRLFDPATDRQVRVLRGHAKEVRCVAFSPDGTQLVSGGGELKVWDVATGQELLSLGSVGCLAFSHCGKRLAVAGHVGRPFCHPDFDRVAASILDGRPLTDEIRIQREAVSLYRGAAQTQLLQAEVVEQLRQDRSVSDAVRQQALAWAEHHHGDPDRLQKAAWPVVRRPGATAEEYRRALRCAEAADRGQPGHTQQLLTLGIAQYRAAQYQEALATLTRVQQLMRAKDEAERARQQMQSPNPTSWSISFEPFPFLVADEAFLAMAHYRLGQKERGRAQLEELRRSLKRLEELHWPRDPDSEAFVRETEALFQEGNP